jgi:hypothetical protein
MDFEDTLSALQGFIGKVVRVGVWGPSDRGALLVAMVWGPFSRAETPPTGDLEQAAGGLAFLVGDRAGGPGGTFILSATQFEQAWWREGEHPPTLEIRQGGVVFTVSENTKSAAHCREDG